MFDNFADLITHNAWRRPHHPALVDATRRLDYASLDLLVTQSALALRAARVGIGDIVGVALGDSIDHVVMLLAIARLGAIIMPMDHRWSVDEKARVARHFGARRVLLAEGAADVPDIATLFFDAGWHAGVAAQPTMGEFPHDRALPMQLSMSSGTTGRPKGPLHTHGQSIDRARGGSASENDGFMVCMPLYFGGGRNFSLGQLFVGGTVIMFPPPYRLEALVEAINGQAVTWTFLVPTLLRRLLKLPDTGTPMFPKLRLLMSSGSMLFAEERGEIMRRLTPNFANVYASTEGGTLTTLQPSHPAEKAGSVGRAVLMSEFQIVDDAHQALPPRQVGRIRHRAPTTPVGFYRDPEETAKYFHDGWYYTGDLGWVDEDGFLFLAGRSKEMIIRGGVNIYPAEIEEPLLQLPEVQDCAAIAWPAQEMGEEVALFVVAATDVTEARILAAARGVLAPYKVPRKVFFVGDLPKNGFGKVLRQELARQLPAFDTLFPTGGVQA